MESSGLAAHIKNTNSIGVRFAWDEYISGVAFLCFNKMQMEPLDGNLILNILQENNKLFPNFEVFHRVYNPCSEKKHLPI